MSTRQYIISIFFLGFLIISCSPSKKTEDPLVQQLPEAEVFTISKDITAISFLPENYLQFAYFDNAAITYEKFTHNAFYTKLKDNYLFLDFKYNFAEDRDMFFSKFNFDFNSIFSYIEKDALLGITNNSFFLVASISFKSKLITSVLNIAPQSVIQKSKKRNYTIYHIRKGSESIFYSVVNEYIIFADSEMTLMDSVDAAERNLNEARNYTERVNDNELIYVKKINSANNPFDLFPVLSEIEILYNTQTEAISYVGLPEDKGEVGEILVDRYSHQTLKYLDPELPLVFYNSSYDFISILKSIASNKNSNTLSSNSQKIDEKLNGVYFLIKDLSPLLTDDSPDLGFVMNVDNGEEIVIPSIQLTSELLGIIWDDGTKSRTTSLYKSNNSDFYLVTSNYNIALFTNENMATEYIKRMENPHFSLYDVHFDSFPKDNSMLNSYICFNPETINSSMRGLIEKYLFSSINMDEYEYKRSFGGLLSYFSEIRKGYMDFTYNQEMDNFYGSVKQTP